MSNGSSPTEARTVLASVACIALACIACGLFDMSKEDRRNWLDQCTGADRAASLAAIEALEKAACRTFGCDDWLGRTKGVCVYTGAEKRVEVYTTYSLQNNDAELEGRSAACDAVRNTILPVGPATVYCQPANRCSTRCGKARPR